MARRPAGAISSRDSGDRKSVSSVRELATQRERERETRLEFKRVDADGDGTDHASVEFLVVRLALGAPDVGQFPFEVWCCRGREKIHPARRDAS